MLEAAAVGVPDKHYGQEILACIVLREGGAADATADPSAEATAPAATQAADHAAIEASLREFCAQHLGRYKTPKRFRFVTELPRGPSGKVQRLKLLDSVG